MLLPDKLVTSVLGTILRVEHLLVLVNQTSDKLREVALEVNTSLVNSLKLIVISLQIIAGGKGSFGTALVIG